MNPSRRLLWSAPVVGAAVVAAAVTLPMIASASPSLPPRTAADLLAAVAQSSNTPMSGTLVETARLGLPALPETPGSAISPTALLSGSHTARVWYDGRDKARVALVGNLAETDLVRNGRDVWLWTSGKNTAQHFVIPAAADSGHDKTSPPATTDESMTPREAAKQALAAVDPSTKVRVDGTASVAGRSAYELVLTPRDARSLIGDVRIAVDSKTSVPLRVQIHAAHSSGRPAFETAFTSVTFAKPAARIFRFSPPPGAKVSQQSVGDTPDDLVTNDKAGTSPAGARPRVHGSGWTAVVEVPRVQLPSGRHNGESGGSGISDQLGAVERAMTPVSGAFGSGRVLRTKLVSVLLLDDGRLFVGAVAPSVLEQVAAQ